MATPTATPAATSLRTELTILVHHATEKVQAWVGAIRGKTLGIKLVPNQALGALDFADHIRTTSLDSEALDAVELLKKHRVLSHSPTTKTNKKRPKSVFFPHLVAPQPQQWESNPKQRHARYAFNPCKDQLNNAKHTQAHAYIPSSLKSTYIPSSLKLTSQQDPCKLPRRPPPGNL